MSDGEAEKWHWGEGSERYVVVVERATGRERNGIEEGEREIGGGGGEDDGRWRWGEMATGREWAVSDREVDRGLVKEN